MTSAKDVIVEHVAPLLGAIFSNIIWLSPCKAVLKVRHTCDIENLNAVPFAAMCAVTVFWVIYGLLIENYYMFGSNAPGLVLSLLYIAICLPYVGTKARNFIVVLLPLSGALICTLALVQALALKSEDQAKQLWGYSGAAVTILFFSSPLSTIVQVVRERNSGSLYWPMTVAVTLNCLFWSIFGLAVMDMSILIPNVTGGALAVIQIILIVVYRPKVDPNKIVARIYPPCATGTGSSTLPLPLNLRTSSTASSSTPSPHGAHPRTSPKPVMFVEQSIIAEYTEYFYEI